MSVHVNFRAAVWLFDSCDMGLHGIPPSCPPIYPACLEAFVLAAGICVTAAFVFKKSKNQKTATEPPAKMLLACLQKKRTDAWGGAGTKRWLPNHAGI